jgi:hypothetical protein
MNIINLNLVSDRIKDLTFRASKMFSSQGPFVEPIELLFKNNELTIKPEDYSIQEGDELYIFERNSGVNLLKKKDNQV